MALPKLDIPLLCRESLEYLALLTWPKPSILLHVKVP